MLLKVVVCVCVCFLGVRAQRAWGSSGGGYNSGFSNSWSSNNGFPVNNNRPSVNDAGLWGSNAPSFGGRPNDKPSASASEQNPSWGYEGSSNSGRNQGKPAVVTGGRQPDSSRRPNEKKLSSITNLPGSSKWSTNSNALPSEEDNNAGVSSWGSSYSGKPSVGQSASQNPKQDNWYSNNRPNENEIPTEYDDESWGSDTNKKKKPGPGFSGGNWESATQNNNKNSGSSKSEANSNYKPQKPQRPGGWDSGDSSQPANEKPTEVQNAKPSTVDTSILDELDKNDWYFGKESNYPKPPFRSTLNIDVSELWNFDKNKKSSQNSRGSGNKSTNNNKNNDNRNNNKNNDNKNNNKNNNDNNRNNNKSNNNNRRWNREIEGAMRIQCECVNVNLCDEEDMIITQEDVKFDLRPLDQFRCDKLSEVCCTNPKLNLASRANFDGKKEQLRCGESRQGGKPFSELGENVVDPGEFPWNLRLENTETNCSASLIHHKMALTAAHCIAGALPGELTVKAGVWNSDDEPQQSRKVIKIIPHPDYNSRNPRNDIALLILETPFELTDNVNTICLPVTNDKWDSNQCVVAGWRPKEIQGQTLEVLEKGVVNFLPQPECQSIMLVTDLWRNYVLHDSFLCGLEKTGRKSCTGDEGGFVVCPSRKRPATYIQIGIVSKGMNCDEFGRPGIFTNVLLFLDWINKTYFDLGLLDEIDIRSLTA